MRIFTCNHQVPQDPLLFDAAPYAVTWRNGEPGHGGRAYAVNASSLALVYEW